MPKIPMRMSPEAGGPETDLLLTPVLFTSQQDGVSSPNVKNFPALVFFDVFPLSFRDSQE